MKQFMVIFHWIFYLITILILAILGPQVLKQEFPYAWGMMEGFTGFDMTGFAFTPWKGSGYCRITNTRIALRKKDTLIALGTIKEASGREYLHLWSISPNKSILDETCPPEKPNCQNRRIFALTDTPNFNVTFQNPKTQEETLTIPWAQEYLKGFIITSPASTK